MTSKDIKQEEVCNAWAKLKGTAYFEACTGFGKTTTSIKIIQKCLKAGSIKSIIVVVPKISLQDHWQQILEKEGIKAEVFVINTYVATEHACDLLILDEAHRYTNEVAQEFSRAIDITIYKFILPLSATFTGEQKLFMRARGIECAASIGLKEARTNEWVSDYIQYNVAVELSSNDVKKVEEHTRIFNSHFAFFEHDLQIALGCLDKSYRTTYCAAKRDGEDDIRYKDSEIAVRAVRLNAAMQGRKKIFYEAECKLIAAKYIIDELRLKTIVFSESIDFAKNLNDVLGYSVMYHSKMKVKEKSEALRQIKSGAAICISTARSLDEGLDVDNLDMSLIASGTSKATQQVQRIGRSIRFIPNKLAFIINLYVPNSNDETWLKKRQVGMNPVKVNSPRQVVELIRERLQ